MVRNKEVIDVKFGDLEMEEAATCKKFFKDRHLSYIDNGGGITKNKFLLLILIISYNLCEFCERN